MGTLSRKIRHQEKGSAQAKQYNSTDKDILNYLSLLLQTHICVGISYPLRIVKVYQDGEFVGEVTSGDDSNVKGDGGLIFGQDQDSVYGGFDPGQAFRQA